MRGAEENQGASKPVPQVIRPVGIGSGEAFGTATIWLAYSFAPEWFKDALSEAGQGSDHHARRREILFSVCAVESYLLEWVRDEVLNRNFEDLETYFPPCAARGIVDKWKSVPRALLRDGRVAAAPDLGGQTWAQFRELVEYRNGLIHARSSRPETHGLPEKSRPEPSKATLDTLTPGWAVRVAAALIRELHQAVGTDPPAWLETP